MRNGQSMQQRSNMLHINVTKILKAARVDVQGVMTYHTVTYVSITQLVSLYYSTLLKHLFKLENTISKAKEYK